MAATGKRLVPGSQIAGSNTTYYTATNLRARIDKCTVCNNTAGAVTFDLFLVPSAGSAGVTNQIIQDKSVGAGETYTCPEAVGHWIESGGFISAGASAATSLTLMVSGIEAT